MTGLGARCFIGCPWSLQTGCSRSMSATRVTARGWMRTSPSLNHEKWHPAARMGATRVHAAVVTAQAERDRLEKLLVAQFDFP